jgi:hypothetical protein
MIKQIKNVQYLQRISIKKIVLIVFSLGMLVMPEDLLHLLAVVLHTVYESIAFAIEHLLIHTAGFTKFQAQMTVFYVSLAVGVLSLIVLIRRIPRMVERAKIWGIQSYNQVRADLIIAWHLLPTRRKVELMLVQFVGVFSVMAFALA